MDRPYPGTRPFRRIEGDRFFGRTTEASDLAGLWQTNRLVIGVGRPAAGKTSLLCAGVLSLVEGAGAEVLPPGRLTCDSAFPLAALPEHNPYTLALLRSWSPGEAATHLAGLTVREFIRRRADRQGRVVLAAIDQAEEMLADSGPRRAYRRRFLDELADALREAPQLHLLLLARESAAGVFSEVLGGGAQYRLMPLSPERAVEAVTGPVAGTARTFAPGAAECLIEDLLTCRIQTANGRERSVRLDYVEPALLQVVCTRLWNSLPTDTDTITTRDVRRYGDPETALADHCGRAIAAVADDHDLRVGALRSWLTRTFVTENGTLGTGYEGPAKTAGMPNAVPRALEDRRILASEWRKGSRWYELLSERLIEPLRHATEQPPPPVAPAECLRAAERALAIDDLDLAERWAGETVRSSPPNALRLRAEVNSLLGNLSHERGKPAEAADHYRDAAGLYEAVRDTAAVAHQLAAVGEELLAQGRAADAVEELRAAADRLPNDLVVQTKLGWALWWLGECRAAVAVLTSVLAVDGGNPDALRARGEILADLGDDRDAIRDLDRVGGRGGPSARAARGLALAGLGDRSAADREIEGALADAPRNGPVLLYAARAESLGGNEVAAAELATRALDASDPALPSHQRAFALRLVSRGGGNRH